ncbi:MAG: hypothetical protein ABIP94_19220 [Planctomycetota bacterium]
MNEQIEQLVSALENAGFSYPVAIRAGRDPLVGDVLEVDAFDLPTGSGVAVAEDLAQVLWPVAFVPTTVLPGVMFDFESGDARRDLPTATTWYRPCGEQRRGRGVS